MNSTLLRGISDLDRIRHQRSVFDEVSIDAKAIKRLGLLRHAFKYGLWALRPGGYLKVADEPSVSQLFATNRIDFWQVRHEFFKSVGNSVCVETVSDKAGEITARKVQSRPLPSGVSFCIVFGGGEKDTELLYHAIKSIHDAAEGYFDKVEVIVCGAVGSELRRQLDDSFCGLLLRYLAYDSKLIAGRIPLADKKNRAFELAQYDAVVVSHTRIVFDKNLVNLLLSTDFEVLSPEVRVLWRDKKVRFVDFVLIGDYQLTGVSSSKALGGYFMLENYLEAMRDRVPYVDGGVMIFNRLSVPRAPFDSRLAWGEAEDVDACARLSLDGVLIDFDPRLKCESNVVKFSPVPSFKYRLTWPVKRALIRRGWY
jgi:hypothetical protein